MSIVGVADSGFRHAGCVCLFFATDRYWTSTVYFSVLTTTTVAPIKAIGCGVIRTLLYSFVGRDVFLLFVFLFWCFCFGVFFLCSFFMKWSSEESALFLGKMTFCILCVLWPC